MPPAVTSAPSVSLVCGDDDFGVKQRARALYQQWGEELGGMDHEIIDASVNNSSEALRALAKLHEALQTLPFFGGAKVIWFQSCNFLDDDRTAKAKDVVAALAELAQTLKAFRWDGVRLLLSAGKVDKRKTLFKTLEKLGPVESFAALSMETKDWGVKAESAAAKQLRALKKNISDEALAQLVALVGPNLRDLANEVEKLTLYVGSRADIEVADVDAVVTRHKHARAFALADAVGNRDLPRVLRTLDEELWEMQFDKNKSEIGLLYGVISKVRSMIFLKEMIAAKWVQPEADYGRFKSQLERVPADAFSEDRRFNPLAMHPFALHNSLPQARRYTSAELVRAMDLLLRANRRLVTSGLDESLVLQQTLTEIVRKNELAAPARA